MRHIWFSLVLAVCASCGSGGSAGPDGGGGGGGGGSPTETKSGTLTIESTRYTVASTQVEQGYATGTFYRIPPMTGPGGGGCTSHTYGACDVQTCTFSGTGNDAGTSIMYTDAGTMTIMGVQVNNGTMTLTPGAYGYDTVSGSVALFDGGETLHFAAPGNPNGAPALNAQLVAPSSVQVTAPQFDQGHVTASASQDLAVAWTGSSATSVTAQLAAGSGTTSAIAHCTFAGTAGGGVVPSAAIAAIAAVGGTSSIMIMTESRTTLTPDGWSITFSAQSYGILPTGLAAGTLDIQ